MVNCQKFVNYKHQLMQQSTLSLLFLSGLLIVSSCTGDSKKPTKVLPESSAEEKLKTALAEHPDSTVLAENLIQYYRENGSYDRALSTVNKVLEQDSNKLRFWEIKAILHFENTDTLSAIRAFEKALMLSPNYADQISLGTLYAQTGNSKAIDFADMLLADKKADAVKEALFIKGLYFSFTNQKQKSIGFFDECIQLNFTFMDAYREKAIAQYDLGNYEAALSTLQRATTLQNNFDEGYYFMGRCLEKLNRKQEAIEAYQMALLYDPSYLEASDALAKLGVKN
jgi:tetratricopeptide (TPR) repeat protein